MFFKKIGKNLKTHWLMIVVVILAIIGGFLAGLLGMVVVKDYFPGNMATPAEVNELSSNLGDLLSKFNQLSATDKDRPLELVIRRSSADNSRSILATTISVGGFWDGVNRGIYDFYLAGKDNGGRFYNPADAAGRAIVLTSDGWLLTSAKALAGYKIGSYIFVSYEKKIYSPEKAVLDPLSDLALVKIKADNLPLPTLADKTPAVGDLIFSLDGERIMWFSNLLSLSDRISTDPAESTEIFSRVYRAKDDLKNLPLGSGVVSQAGAIIGIIGLDGKGNQAIIPFTYWANQISKVFKNNNFDRIKMGVKYLDLSYATLSESELKTLGLTQSFNKGVMVLDAARDSAAYKAGLRTADIIFKVNDQDINGTNNLTSVIQNLDVGDAVELKIWRAGKEMTINFVVEGLVKKK